MLILTIYRYKAATGDRSLLKVCVCVCFNQTPVGRKPIVSEKGNHVALPAGQTMCFISLLIGRSFGRIVVFVWFLQCETLS